MITSSLQDYVFASKYSRYLPGKKRRETYVEAVGRVIDMHRRHFLAKGIEVEDLLSVAGDAMREKRVLGSQRALQFGGQPILDKNARLYNCTTSYCDRIRFFQEAMWLLLCGCGVGFSVQWHHVAKLPAIAAPKGQRTVFYIDDCIEGWADALGALISSYAVSGQSFPELGGRVVEFDYSSIRPRGARLSYCPGKAPGPEPLERSLELVRALLDRCLAEGQDRLRPIDAYDILMHAADAVLSGGVRRSATICLFSPDDEEMAAAKTGNWFTENPQRARSNNSALLLRDKTGRDQFDRLIKTVQEFGEPGFVWADHVDVTFNPCVEIGLYPAIEGQSGWAFCNLAEINMGAVESVRDFTDAARAAAIIGTLQADYTSFPYLGEISERIARREALIGVSMTGMMESPEFAFDPDLQRRMAAVVLETNGAVASRLGLNPAARATCVKPAGSTSCLLGTSSGIHPHHARRYFRRAQANKDEALVEFFREANPLAVEESVWNPNGTDVVLTFCVEAGDQARIRNDVTALELLEKVKTTKANWIDGGRRPECCAQPWLSHNVSNTITVREHEWSAVADFIYENRHVFAGVSLLPESGDLDYPQAPFCEVWTAGDIVDFYGVGAIMSSGLIVDGLQAFDDNLWAACDAALGRGKEPSAVFPPYEKTGVKNVWGQKKDWVRRARKFAINYFEGDVLNMTRCLKHVHNCKRWEDLQRQTRRVDYTALIEEEDTTGALQTFACGGGVCELL